jgi:hypothetical protein
MASIEDGAENIIMNELKNMSKRIDALVLRVEESKVINSEVAASVKNIAGNIQGFGSMISYFCSMHDEKKPTRKRVKKKVVEEKTEMTLIEWLLDRASKNGKFLRDVIPGDKFKQAKIEHADIIEEKGITDDKYERRKYIMQVIWDECCNDEEIVRQVMQKYNEDDDKFVE